jgi:peptidoglycan/LPS O-acetylase OafA/YrhL
MLKNIPFLDFAKGYAIFTIMLYHALQKIPLPGMAQQAIIFGGTGVHLFFLLSGYGLMLSKSSPTAGAFYRRRLTKIWLPYVLALTFSLVFSLAFGLFPDRWAAWCAGVGLYQMFSPDYIESFGGHFWFISAIIQFYLVFPALRWLYGRFAHVWQFVLLALVLSVGWWLIVFGLGKGDLRNWNSFFLQFLWEFALGMALAGRYTRTGLNTLTDYVRWPLYLPLGLLGTAVMVGIVLKAGELGRVFNDVPALLGYTALCVFAYHVADKFVPPLRNFFQWVNSFSFSLYLVHIIFLALLLRVLAFAGQSFSLMWLPVYVALALAGGRAFEWLSQRLFS